MDFVEKQVHFFFAFICSVAERRNPRLLSCGLMVYEVPSLRDGTSYPNGLLMKWLRIVYNGRMKIKNAFVVSVASFVALCASFGTAHGAENPANGLLMKTFEFGDSGVCAANFIERSRRKLVRARAQDVRPPRLSVAQLRDGAALLRDVRRQQMTCPEMSTGR